MTERFAKTLKKWRGRRYQKNAADDLQIPLATYRKYENGKRTPPKLALAELTRRMAAAPDGLTMEKLNAATTLLEAI